MVTGSTHQLLDNSPIQLGTNASVVPSTTVLGVFIDQSLTMTSPINIVTGRCFRSLRQMRNIRRSLALNAVRMLVSSLVMWRIDYCDCILVGLPDLHRQPEVVSATRADQPSIPTTGSGRQLTQRFPTTSSERTVKQTKLIHKQKKSKANSTTINTNNRKEALIASKFPRY